MEMDLRERRWQMIEESSKMRDTRYPKKARRIKHRFEPDRLSPTRLADAYEIILPRSIRIFDVNTNETVPERIFKPQTVGG